MTSVRALILTGFGINCEEEMAAAYRLVGAHAEIVHINEVLGTTCSIHDYHILNLPGGFSFGDDLGSGKVLANKLKYRRLADGRPFFAELLRFIEDGRFILGICNGFQALVKMGLLPDVSGQHRQEVTLTLNDSGRFEDRWVHCRVNPECCSPFLAGMDRIQLPVRHGEGKLVVCDAAVVDRIASGALNCLSYCDPAGRATGEYPFNPNGSMLACAGLTDRTGRILGMMPHPEAFLSLFNHPDWARLRRETPDRGEEGQGLTIFRNIVHHLQRTQGA